MKNEELINIYLIECENCGRINYDSNERDANMAAVLHQNMCEETEVQKTKLNLEELTFTHPEAPEK